MNGNCDMIKELDTILGNKNIKTFLLIFMEGCGPCNATRPEWSKIKNVLSRDFLKRRDIVVAAIDNQLADKLVNLKTKPTGFPTMRFITDGGNTSENYEDSNIIKKDRTIDSFVEWIHSKIGQNLDMQKSDKPYKRQKIYKKNKSNKPYKNQNNKTHKKQKGGKWSLKYKKSINCNRPKGFSQKQYCKYSRK